MVLKNFYQCLIGSSDYNYNLPGFSYPVCINGDTGGSVYMNAMFVWKGYYNKCSLWVSSDEQDLSYTKTAMTNASGKQNGTTVSIAYNNNNNILAQTLTWTNNTGSDYTVKSVGYAIGTSSTIAQSFLLVVQNLAEYVTVPAGSTITVTFKFTIGGNPIV